jgi:hypothetical protein
MALITDPVTSRHSWIPIIYWRSPIGSGWRGIASRRRWPKSRVPAGSPGVCSCSTRVAWSCALYWAAIISIPGWRASSVWSWRASIGRSAISTKPFQFLVRLSSACINIPKSTGRGRRITPTLLWLLRSTKQVSVKRCVI